MIQVEYSMLTMKERYIYLMTVDNVHAQGCRKDKISLVSPRIGKTSNRKCSIYAR